ncbi:hypothetical protein DFH27DRAFT_616473 [Peziza echinospora]|nr:hypothetical protein DFH27DRAFT_616473 [Peziza echinospora]
MGDWLTTITWGTLSDIKSPQSPPSNISSPRYQAAFLSPLHQPSVPSSSITQLFPSLYLSIITSSFTLENSCLFKQSTALTATSSSFTIGDTIINNITNLYLSYIHTMSGSWYCSNCGFGPQSGSGPCTACGSSRMLPLDPLEDHRASMDKLIPSRFIQRHQCSLRDPLSLRSEALDQEWSEPSYGIDYPEYDSISHSDSEPSDFESN